MTDLYALLSNGNILLVPAYTDNLYTDGLQEITKMKYRNRIPEPGTTISGFADNKFKKK